MKHPFNPLARAAYIDARAYGYDSAADARNGERKRALRDARDLLRRAELLATGARPDSELAQGMAIVPAAEVTTSAIGAARGL